MRRKFLSILLAVCMVLTMLPATAFATELPPMNEEDGIQGLAGDANAIMLSQSEVTVTPDQGVTVLIRFPGEANSDLWCSVTGNEKNAFTAVNDFLNTTENKPMNSWGTQLVRFVSADNVAPGTYTMTVTICGRNHDTLEVYTPATLTVKMTVSEPVAKWGTDDTYAAGSGTLVKAMAYANSLNGGTAYIQLQSNVTVDNTLQFNKTTVLDLNGKTIDAQGKCAVLRALGHLTLKDDSTQMGKITGGMSDSSGGGVYVGASGSFTMLGGEITGNTALANGGGVYVAGSMTVGGKAKISGNTKNAAANNVYLASGKTIAVSTVPLVDGASISVKTQTIPRREVPVNITGPNGSDMSRYFVSDKDTCAIQNSGSGAEQVVQLVASGQTTDVLISTAEELRDFAAKVNAGDDFDGKTVKLMNNVTLTGEWTPIGTMGKLFAGMFDGQGHTVSGMSIIGNVKDAGFFGATNGATIQNLTVSGSISVSGQDSVAGIVTTALEDTILTNCHSAVNIKADMTEHFSAGGIAAKVGNHVKIDGCSNNGEMNGEATSHNDDEVYMGGIAGIILGVGAYFTNCANTGALTASTIGSDDNTVYLGGIVGHLMATGDAAVINCYSSGTLNANASGSAAVGGIAGLNFSGAIINCYQSGSIASTAGSGKTNSVGGIVGCGLNGSVKGSYWKAGTADNCVNSLGDNDIYHCGSFDTAGVLTATTDTNAGAEHAKHGLSYGDTLLAALNGWVADQTSPADYRWWIVKSDANEKCPIFGTKSIAAPTFSLVGGVYTDAKSVKISCATTGADIYYTTNGSTPTTGSAKYTTPISVSATTTLKAIAVKSGLEDSDVATVTYTIKTQTSGGHNDGSHETPTDNKPESVVTVPTEAPVSIDSKGNATVTITQEKLSEILKEAKKIAGQQGVKASGIVAELTANTPTETQSLTITLPKAIQDMLVKEEVVELKIHSNAIQISLDKACIRAIQSTAGTDAQMTAKPATVGSAEAKAAIGNRPVFDLTLTFGGKTMNHFGTGKVSIGIPYTLGNNEQASNIAVVYVDEAGKVTWLKQSSYDTTRKMVVFTTDHFSTYGVAYKLDESAFSDIGTHWAKDNILFVTQRGVFTGIGNGKFGPDLPLTREMFVTALGRLAQADVNGYQESSFSDVKKDAYSMGYIEWANKNSIVNGIGNGEFAPNQAITREQMARIIQNYTNIIGVTLPKVHTENTFADSAEISAYAKEAVKQMQMAGVLSGKTGNFFDPQGNATRAEVSAVFKRLVEQTTNSDKPQG